MKNSNELNEQELDDISGGPAFVKLGDFMPRAVIWPDYKVGVVNPNPHPGKRAPGYNPGKGASYNPGKGASGL